MKKKILVIGTGGTIASVSADEGLKPRADVSELLTCVPEVKEFCKLDMIQAMSIDSTNMMPANWKVLVKIIEQQYDVYDGFLILHGTDTMAYTASALSYMIQNSEKPIVLTGSQRPMEENRTDAKENIYQSIRYLVHKDAFGVNIVFAGKVIPGTRARKYKSHSLDAFECVSVPCRAEFHDKKLLIYETKPDKEYATHFYYELEERILLWKIIPGMSSEWLLKLSEEFEAVVIEGFGLGGIPDVDRCAYFHVLESLVKRGKVIVVTTQVSYEGTDMSVYEVGKKYKTKLDVLEGSYMTTEAIVTKLMWLLGMTKERQEIKRRFVETINKDLVEF